MADNGVFDPESLHRLEGLVTNDPADTVDLEVADALLPGGLPFALRELLQVSNGVRVGETEVFGTSRLIAANEDSDHRWALGEQTLVIGQAGAGSALVMSYGRPEVCEVDDDPWDARTTAETSDTPLELFTVHQGRPLAQRSTWWAVPGLDDAMQMVRTSLREELAAMAQTVLGAANGEPFSSELSGLFGFAAADPDRAEELLTAADWESFLINYRPDPPRPGSSAQVQWRLACDALLDPDHGELLDAARSTRTAPGVPSPDTVREFAFLSVLAKAREELAAQVTGDTGTRVDGPGHRLAAVYAAGHVPVSLNQAR